MFDVKKICLGALMTDRDLNTMTPLTQQTTDSAHPLSAVASLFHFCLMLYGTDEVGVRKSETRRWFPSVPAV